MKQSAEHKQHWFSKLKGAVISVNDDKKSERSSMSKTDENVVQIRQLLNKKNCHYL